VNDKLDKRKMEGDDTRSYRQIKEELERNDFLAASNIGHLVHELQVHQAELEAQNYELRQTHLQLEETRDRYADLYDFAPVGYLTLENGGRILEINLTGAAMLGQERQNIVGQPLQNFLHLKEVQSFPKHILQACAAKGNVSAEFKLKTYDGKLRIVRLESMAVLMSNTCRSVMIDITLEYLAEDALQRNLAAQEALLQAVPALVFYMDINLKFVAVSELFADLLGHSIDDIIGKSPYEIMPQALGIYFKRSGREVLDSGQVFVTPEFEMRDANGKQIFISMVRTPYRDAFGNILGMVGAGVDITPLKNAANLKEEILSENRRLTRALFEMQEKERRHIARELHDELGQWLTAIQAEAQAICNISDSESKIHLSAKAINASASATHEVVRGMLRNLRPSLLDELGLADSLRELQRQWCRSHPNLKCALNLDTSFAGLEENIIITIYRLIQEALSNISIHAGASKVDVTINREATNKFAAVALLITVIDDGVGFDMHLPRNGMGLLGMRERVIAAGGHFMVYSAPGKGTHIEATIPLHEETS
jgi:PAS domain S-box-containing protein